jgi:hypothetical protein
MIGISQISTISKAHFNLKRNSEKNIQPAEGGLEFIALGCQDHSEKRAGISRPDPV